MNRISLTIIAVVITLLAVRCGSNRQPTANENNPTPNLMKEAELMKGENKNNGIGKFKDIQLSHPLDETMITKGQPIYESKCFACHKLTDEKLVGPGWKGVTDRRTPEWIMNFITNTDVMLDSDLVAQKMMVTCVVRMPNQILSDEDARALLEFMRKNDGKN